jgi:DinB superfamily
MSELPKPLADVWGQLSAERSRLIDRLAGLDAEATLRAPGPGEWSIAQVVDHLLLAEGFTNDFMKARLEQAAAAGEATGFPETLERFDPLPPPLGMEAPPPIRPQKELPAQELIEALRAMSERTRESLELLAAVDPRRYRMPHPLFGELDFGQWWVVHAIHYVMHNAQAVANLGQSV